MIISSKGQVTIPIYIRKKLGFLPNNQVEFYIDEEEIKIKKIQSSKKGDNIIKKMTSYKKINMTTKEIMSLTRGW